jgi:hypothetical protein
MSRGKTAKAAVYVNLSPDDINNIVLASAGTIKDKEVDPRKLVGTIHIKKYLADLKINGKVEAWIAILKKLIAPVEEGESAVVLTSEELATLEECKTQTKLYLGDDASDALKKKALESGEEYKTLKEVSSSMKFKFSRHAYETVTHVINLMVREILAFTCDNCASQKAKLTKIAHIPWADLQTKLLAGMYMNTKTVYYVLHPEEPSQSTRPSPDEPIETADEVEAEVEDSGNDEVKVLKPRLSQYISNTFKEIIARDERFKGLLLGKEITALVNDIIYNVLDRYANVIKSLLQTGNSKTVNERLAIISTKVLLQDHVHATDADVAVVLDVVQARLEDLKNVEKDAPDNEESGDAPDNEESGLSDTNTKP